MFYGAYSLWDFRHTPFALWNKDVHAKQENKTDFDIKDNSSYGFLQIIYPSNQFKNKFGKSAIDAIDTFCDTEKNEIYKLNEKYKFIH